MLVCRLRQPLERRIHAAPPNSPKKHRSHFRYPSRTRSQEAVQGAYADGLFSLPLSHPNQARRRRGVLRRRFMGRTLLKTAHRRKDCVSGRRSRLSLALDPLVPGLLSFRARVILLAPGTDGFPDAFQVMGKERVPHPPEPPLFFFSPADPRLDQQVGPLVGDPREARGSRPGGYPYFDL